MYRYSTVINLSTKDRIDIQMCVFFTTVIIFNILIYMVKKSTRPPALIMPHYYSGTYLILDRITDANLFHMTCHLTPALDWCRQSPPKQWVQVEQLLAGIPLDLVMWWQIDLPSWILDHPTWERHGGSVQTLFVICLLLQAPRHSPA